MPMRKERGLSGQAWSWKVLASAPLWRVGQVKGKALERVACAVVGAARRTGPPDADQRPTAHSVLYESNT
jgi:hypothetical protein